MDDTRRIVAVYLDEKTVPRRSREVDRDRAVAIYDLLEENSFEPADDVAGPFNLHISVEENRLRLDVRNQEDGPLTEFTLPLTTVRSVIKDYMLMCESYYEAIKVASPSKIEAIDMGRRGLHNEGSELLRERLKSHVAMDFDTARRLFTLICVMLWR